ncbi:carbonic anhydrase [Plasmodium gaboni]|uniref:Carbonic anhydrase n=1 Tax=Plasmodium gaboni TaxID=647221 RepID=A0ABY1UPH6_9APIC|nr:carbonic anhydrase [Plasmodium gaboni]
MKLLCLLYLILIFYNVNLFINYKKSRLLFEIIDKYNTHFIQTTKPYYEINMTNLANSKKKKRKKKRKNQLNGSGGNMLKNYEKNIKDFHINNYEIYKKTIHNKENKDDFKITKNKLNDNQELFHRDSMLSYMQNKNNLYNYSFSENEGNSEKEEKLDNFNNMKNINTLQNNINKTFLYNKFKNIDYYEHGYNWNIGQCKTGEYQSPVDLPMKNLKERELKNISDVYLNLFDDDNYAWNNYNKPWMKGDIFYYYEYFIKKIVINRQNNIFQIKAARDGIIPFGVLFTTDQPAMFYADQIHFHAPSEHTFQGSGNRREIEMQIFHSTNYVYDALDEKTKYKKKYGLHIYNNLKKNSKETSKKDSSMYHTYLMSFLMNSLSNEQLQNKYHKKKRMKTMKNQYEVISITFTSAEINASTINAFEKLPSEKFLRTIINVSNAVNVGSDPTLVELKEALNLDALMMMLNIEDMQFLSYEGSSTLPLCNENVSWKVAKQPLPASTETILNFYNLLKKHTPNYSGSDNDNYRSLQNVEDNTRHYRKFSLVQIFPIQVLISSAISNVEDNEVINIIKDISPKNMSFSYYSKWDIYFILFIFYNIVLFLF